MNKLMTVIFAASAVAAALPAAAAPFRGYDADRPAQLQADINEGLHNRTLTLSEAATLRARLHDVQTLEFRYRADGLSYGESRDLVHRYDAVASQIHQEMSDNQRGWRHHGDHR